MVLTSFCMFAMLSDIICVLVFGLVFWVSVSVFCPKCSSVCAACCQEHTPSCICGVSFDVPSLLEHWPNVLCVNWPFLRRLWQLGGWAYGCPPGQTAAAFPHPALRQWSLVQHPLLLNVGPHVSTSLSHRPCVFFSLHLPRLVCSPRRVGVFIRGTFAPLLCLCFPSSLLSARTLAGYKIHCCRVTTLLYSKHLATFPHPQTEVMIHHPLVYASQKISNSFVTAVI